MLEHKSETQVKIGKLLILGVFEQNAAQSKSCWSYWPLGGCRGSSFEGSMGHLFESLHLGVSQNGGPLLVGVYRQTTRKPTIVGGGGPIPT